MACNDFGGPLHSEQQIREALDLSEDVPLVECDARDRSSSKYVLITLVEHLAALSAARLRAAGTTASAAAAPTAALAAAGPTPEPAP